MRKRRTFAPKFKADLVLSLLRSEKTAAQLCREHNLGAELVSQWKTQFLERAPNLFVDQTDRTAEDQRVAELERVIGRQTVEIELLKKATAWSSAASRSSGP